MKIFETHTHYEDRAFDADREEMIKKGREAGVECFVNVGSDLETSRKSVEIARKYGTVKNRVYAAVGVHPENASDFDEKVLDEIEKLAENPEVIAIGEIGLDYHWEDACPREKQKPAFTAQLELAAKLDKTIIIHSRDAAEDTFEILKKFAKKMSEEGKTLRLVMHCYGYSPELAKEYVKLGFYIGVGGVLTFKNARKLRESVLAVPRDRVVFETDSPYMSPEPERGTRNDPSKLRYVAEKLAKLWECTTEEAAAICYENALRLFGL